MTIDKPSQQKKSFKEKQNTWHSYCANSINEET